MACLPLVCFCAGRAGTRTSCSPEARPRSRFSARDSDLFQRASTRPCRRRASFFVEIGLEMRKRFQSMQRGFGGIPSSTEGAQVHNKAAPGIVRIIGEGSDGRIVGSCLVDRNSSRNIAATQVANRLPAAFLRTAAGLVRRHHVPEGLVSPMVRTRRRVVLRHDRPKGFVGALCRVSLDGSFRK